VTAHRPGGAAAPAPDPDGRARLAAALETAIAPLEGAEEAVVVADGMTLEILAVNRAARELLDGRTAVGRPLEWMFPDVDGPGLRERVHALVGAGGRSMGVTARVVWDARGGRPTSARLDVVRRDGVPLLVAFVRAPPEPRLLRPDGAGVLGALPDRGAFLALLDAEVRRASRHGRTLAVVAVSLTLPAPLAATGETQAAVLAGVAEHLRGAVRAEEPVGRVAHAAFAWLLPEAAAAGARVAAERVRDALLPVLMDAGAALRVGSAALVPGDAAAALLQRAEADARDDPGPGRRAARAPAELPGEAAALLRAALDGDARAVEERVAAALARHGSPGGFDEVVHPVAGRIRREGDDAPGRSAAGHRALALIEWAVARRTPVHPPPDAPVAALVPLGAEARRLVEPAAVDAAAAAGWMPVALQMPPAADLAPPLRRLGARAVLAVLGDDADLVEAGHLLRALGESLGGTPLFAVAAPGGILTRWTPPTPALPVQAATLLADLLAHLRASPPAG